MNKTTLIQQPAKNPVSRQYFPRLSPRPHDAMAMLWRVSYFGKQFRYHSCFVKCLMILSQIWSEQPATSRISTAASTNMNIIFHTLAHSFHCCCRVANTIERRTSRQTATHTQIHTHSLARKHTHTTMRGGPCLTNRKNPLCCCCSLDNTKPVAAWHE